MKHNGVDMSEPKDYLPEFVKVLEAELERAQKKWGDTWLNRPRAGQEARIERDLADYFDRFKHAGQPIPWHSIAGLALIAWVRENHPELFPE
jgi:sugar (pentulose or hexulose) kinase